MTSPPVLRLQGEPESQRHEAGACGVAVCGWNCGYSGEQRPKLKRFHGNWV